ncbi:MAG: TonB-dependent receptor [Gammaproteobacteria bacterium]|nr:TonB-dependent receptor [Gammaproteobacteria bacterium]
MKTIKPTLVALAATSIGCAAAPLALAQGNDSDSLFEEIVVTATKREQNIYEVPMSISAFSGDSIEAQGITDLVDVGKFVPNLNVTTFSAGHTSSANPFIRGIGLQDHLITTDPGVSVYVDGVYLGRQVGQNWNLTNIERIEVLRGPQGTLYGRNSIGGAINIITKTPGSDEGARAAVQVGSRGRLNADVYADTRLSDDLAVSFSGGFKKRDGVGTYLNLPNAGVEVGETKDVFARMALSWEVNDDFSLVIAADANDGDNGMNPYTTMIDEVGLNCRNTAPDPNDCAGDPDDLGYSAANGRLYDRGYRNADVSPDPYDSNSGEATQTRVTNEASGLSITGTWALSDTLETKFIASHRTSEYKAGLDDDSFLDTVMVFPEVGDADQTSIEVQFNGDMGAWDFVSGIYYFTEDGTNFQDGYTFNGAGPFDFFLTQEVTSTAIFGNVGYDVSDELRVSGGLRYTRDEKDAVTDVGTGLVSGNRSWNELSWDLAANYTMNNGLSVYGSIASGYQSGQFPARPFCLFTAPGCFVAGDNITATNYEIGIKGQPMDNLQMSAAVFYTDYKDLPYQVSTTAGAGFNTVNLIVKQQSTGFEWENTLFITDAFLFRASLGYIDVSVDRQQNVQPVAPLTPELTFSLSPEFRMPMASGAELTFRADYSYRDDMFGEPTSDPARFTMIDSRGILNVDFAYQSPDGSWTAALYGRNVTDERYDNGRLNTGDYILRILSNDASEFGVRFAKSFGL